MKRDALSWVLGGWMPAVLLVVTGVAVLRLTCPGCVDQSRANTNCELTADRSFAIDVNNPAQWRHLVRDAQLAEELAVQYGDANFYRWAFPARTAASGPVQTSDTHADNVRAQVACLARLNAVIASAHAVTAEQIAVARGARSRVRDGMVLLLFVPLYAAACGSVCRRFRNLIHAEGLWPRLIARAVASVSIAPLGLNLFFLWTRIFEGGRVRNPQGHFGARAASLNYWSYPVVAALLIGGVVAFWIVAALSSQELDDAPPARGFLTDYPVSKGEEAAEGPRTGVMPSIKKDLS